MCIVGGDVCRPADAAAAGLAPCLTGERWWRQDTTLDIAVVRLGGHGEWQLAVRSDGRATVTRLEENEGGLTAGAGVTFSPLGVEAEVEGAVTLGYRGGEAWRFASAREATAFLARAERDAGWREARPPAVRWRAIAAGADGEAAAASAISRGPGCASARTRAIGLRTEGARRTLTLEVGRRDLRLFGDLPGFRGRGRERRRRGRGGDLGGRRPEELVIRTARAGGDRRRRVHRAAAARRPGATARRRGGAAPGRRRDGALAAQIAREGVLEHAAYAVSERRRGISVVRPARRLARLEHERVTGERRLVGRDDGGPRRPTADSGSTAWNRDRVRRRRADAVGAACGLGHRRPSDPGARVIGPCATRPTT